MLGYIKIYKSTNEFAFDHLEKDQEIDNDRYIKYNILDNPISFRPKYDQTFKLIITTNLQF